MSMVTVQSDPFQSFESQDFDDGRGHHGPPPPVPEDMHFGLLFVGTSFMLVLWVRYRHRLTKWLGGVKS